MSVDTSAEITQHQRVVRALEEGVANRNWFLWVNVDGGGAGPDAADLSRLSLEVEEWLNSLTPDAASDRAARTWRFDGIEIRLHALPKKPHARGAEPLVGNPFPAFAYWT